MAIWKLTEPHYLNVPGTEWEQVTTDRITQRPVRKKFPVPLHLDPRIESDWNYDAECERPARQGDMDGSIVVANKAHPKYPRAYIFVGDPTPGMLPLDDEAKEISGKFSWTPTREVDFGFGNEVASVQANVLNGLIKQLAEATVRGTPAAPAGFEKFMEAMAVMMQQQNQLLAAILGKQQEVEFKAQAEAAGAVPADEAEPLENAEPPTEEELAQATKAAAAKDHASRLKAAAHMASRRV